MEQQRQLCSTCAFWVPLHRDDLGECHRYPPTVHRPDAKPADARLSVMPFTDKSDWYGEWQRLLPGQFLL